jgi:ElaB/YqjD/DUF883 family membrane-anchored ribosome-binding protein
MNDKAQSKSTSPITRDAMAKIQEVADEARSAVTERADLVRDQAESVKAKAAERVRKLGHAVRKIGEHMRIEDQRYIAEHAQSASQRLESVASYIDDSELSTLIRDAETVARRNPAWVIGGTFLVGLAAGRILKVPSGESVELADERVPQLARTSDEQPAPATERRNGRGSNRDDGDGPKQAGALR